MLRITALFGLFLTASPALALDHCAEWWFTRNLAFDRAGYCFSSALGQALFDNSNCTTRTVAADPSDRDLVDTIQFLEAQLGCKVDTGRTNLPIDAMAVRMRMVDLPVADEYESACYGWRGRDIALHTARDDSSPVTGAILTGDDILFQFIGVDDWSFVLSQRNGSEMGWTRDIVWADDSCESSAG